MSKIRSNSGKWLDVSLFRHSGDRFKKLGYYTDCKEGSSSWKDFWYEERRRCLEGYSIGNDRITGDHYFYLNYCPIMKVDKDNKRSSKKVKGFPDFWDGDYDYFWSRDIARNGIDVIMSDKEIDEVMKMSDYERLKYKIDKLKDLNLGVKIFTHRRIKSGKDNILISYLDGGMDMIVGKSRRKGYSNKNGGVGANNYHHKQNCLTLYNAYEEKYLTKGGIVSMARDFISFNNDNCAWSMPSQEVDRKLDLMSSYIEYKGGIKVVKGFKSRIMGITCNDNPDANRGKDAYDLIIDEAGSFGSPGLLNRLYYSSVETTIAGSIKTGMVTIFGTSGDLNKGTVDYADMFMSPERYNFLPFRNIWDKKCEDQIVGFFHPVNRNMEGYYDSCGNSDVNGAMEFEENERKKLVSSGISVSELSRRKQERPFGPNEAFSVVVRNIFPTEELNKQLIKVNTLNLNEKKGVLVDLSYDGSEVVLKMITDGSKSAIGNHRDVGEGCVVIYEQYMEGSVSGLYSIGYDPVRHDSGTSLAGIIVYKGTSVDSMSNNIIVAEYIGRKETTDEIHEIAMMLGDYYHTKVMYENEVLGFQNFLKKRKRLDVLALQPNRVISKSVRKSRVNRVYGCHMNKQLKNDAKGYVKDWLLQVVDHDENGDKVRIMDKIYSKRLLNELINYHDAGNFDLVSALFMCMFQIQENEIKRDNNVVSKNDSLKEMILDMMDNN